MQDLIRRCLTMFVFVLAVACVGCADSHGDGDAGSDTGADTSRPDSGRMCVGMTMLCFSGTCCEDRVAANLDLTTCEQTCPRGTSPECRPDPSCDRTTCESSFECEIVDTDVCCGCGSEYISLHRDDVADYRSRGDCPPECPPCAPPLPSPPIVPTCDLDVCSSFDLTPDLVACESDSDCRVRTKDCCECGGRGDPLYLVALNRDAEGPFASRVCSGDLACPECAAAYPDVTATCVDERCTLQFGVDP